MREKNAPLPWTLKTVVAVLVAAGGRCGRCKAALGGDADDSGPDAQRGGAPDPRMQNVLRRFGMLPGMFVRGASAAAVRRRFRSGRVRA